MPKAINSSQSISSSNFSLVSGQHAMGTTLSGISGNKTSFKKSGLTLDELRRKQARIQKMQKKANSNDKRYKNLE